MSTSSTESEHSIAPPSHTPNAESHPVRRQLEVNRFQNQQRRRAWEKAKEESVVVCREYIGDFVRCSEGRTFSVIWACKPHNAWMTKCMKTYMETNSKEAAFGIAEKMKREYEATQSKE